MCFGVFNDSDVSLPWLEYVFLKAYNTHALGLPVV